MSQLEELLFEVYLRAFDDIILGIAVFFIIIGMFMFRKRIPASAALPIAYVLVSGILLQMPGSQYIKPIEAALIMGGGVLLVLGILFLARRR